MLRCEQIYGSNDVPLDQTVKFNITYSCTIEFETDIAYGGVAAVINEAAIAETNTPTAFSDVITQINTGTCSKNYINVVFDNTRNLFGE